MKGQFTQVGNSHEVRKTGRLRPTARIVIVAGWGLSITILATAFIPEPDGVRIPVTCSDGKLGYINESGRMVIAPRWASAGPFGSDASSEVRRLTRRHQFERSRVFPYIRIATILTQETMRINRSGYVVERSDGSRQTSRRDETRDFDEFGMTMIRNHEGVRWIRKDGSPAFPGIWKMGTNFHGEDPAAVYRNGRWGFISREGKMITGYDWDHVYGFRGSGCAIVLAGSSSGCIDREGRFLIPLGQFELGPFDEQGISICRQYWETGTGAVDCHGRIVIPFRFVQLEPFDCFNMARAVIRTGPSVDELRVGWIDRIGNTTIPFSYDRYGTPFGEGFKNHPLLPVGTDQGWGLIDRKGRMIIPSGKNLYKHIEDPLAPEKSWIVSMPPESASKAVFSPVCYDLNGKLIWKGSRFTRQQVLLGSAGLSGIVSALILAILKKKSPLV